MDTIIYHLNAVDQHIFIASLENKGRACPAQWDGETDTGAPVYIRYRAGNFTIDVDDFTVYRTRLDRDDAPMTDAELFKYIPWFVCLNVETLDGIIATLREQIRAGLVHDEMMLLAFDEMNGAMDALMAEAEEEEG